MRAVWYILYFIWAISSQVFVLWGKKCRDFTASVKNFKNINEYVNIVFLNEVVFLEDRRKTRQIQNEASEAGGGDRPL